MARFSGVSATTETIRILGSLVLCTALLAGCGGTDGAEDPGKTVVSDQTKESGSEPEETEETEEAGALPDTPQAYSTLTVVGDVSVLPPGTEGEVTVAAISEPEDGTSFPIILHNGTESAVSRIEVSGRAVGPDNATLGTGSSQSIEPNVVPPGGYAFGYVYIDTSEYSLPAGSSIPDLRLQFTEGLGDFENIVTLDVENFEQLPSGDFTGDVTNPHDIEVSGPISVDSTCLTADGRILQRSDFTDGDTVTPGGSVTWTLSTYDDDTAKDCALTLVSASGFES